MEIESFQLQWLSTYIVFLFAGDRVAADLSVLNGRQIPDKGGRSTSKSLMVHLTDQSVYLYWLNNSYKIDVNQQGRFRAF